MAKQIIEDYDAFQQWMTEFVHKNGGIVPTRQWFDEVQDHHQRLRQFLGGVRKDIQVDAEYCATTVTASVEKRGLEILLKLAETGSPNYGNLKQFGVLSRARIYRNDDGYGFDFAVLDKNIQHGVRPSQELVTSIMKQFLQPTIQLAPHRFISTTKFLSQAAVERTKEQLSLISELGKLHGEVKKKGDRLTARVSTSAKAFMLLGHCGPDKNSCFGQSGGRQLDKLALGMSNETFVIVLYKEDKPVARAWGQVQHDGKETMVVHVCNVYSKNIPCGVVEAALKDVAVFLTGNNKSIATTDVLGELEEDHSIYLNGDMRISAGMKKTLDGSRGFLDTCDTDLCTNDGFHRGFMCSQCHTVYNNLDCFQDRDGEPGPLVCESCQGSVENDE